MSQDTVHAVVTRPRGINRDAVHVKQGGIIEDMSVDQFGDWNRLNIVERATDEQVAAHREAIAQAEAEAAAQEAEQGDQTEAAPKPAPKRPSRAKKVAKPRPSRAKKPSVETPAEPASPLTAPVLGTVTTEPEATDAPEASA